MGGNIYLIPLLEKVKSPREPKISQELMSLGQANELHILHLQITTLLTRTKH